MYIALKQNKEIYKPFEDTFSKTFYVAIYRAS